ncbi:MAG: glycine cleavage T C-terminal barrel domain-containing protein, partial [Gammaproteobacteria bacterium]
KRFVDFQNDVTAEDVGLAVREGYGDVEHLKRYTTLGMGTDQGRTSNVNGLALLGALTGRDISSVGVTTFRPPFAPVTLGAVAGPEVGRDIAPVRRTPLHDWHLDAGAPMMNAGLWQRPQAYPLAGESLTDAIERESRLVRQAVGIVDVSTLGKIEVHGADAGTFLDRIYSNRFATLAVGRCRYGLMLREDGFVMDDGTATRIGEHNYYVTTTTGHAAHVLAHMEYYAQTVWPDLRVRIVSVTDQWAGIALAGPRSREVLARVVEDTSVDNSALPYLGFMQTSIESLPVRLLRVTFSGELGYEIHVPANGGVAVWEKLLEAGKPYGIAPYGVEAMGVLRIEKGHIVHAEIDGRATAEDVGLGPFCKPDAPDFIGQRALERPDLQGGERKRLVGLTSVNGQPIPRGAHLVRDPHEPPPVEMLGHVSSVCYSPNLGQHIALALLAGGREAFDGQTLCAASPMTGEYVRVRIGPAASIDPKGERARG